MFGFSQKDKNAALISALTDEEGVNIEALRKALAKGADPNCKIRGGRAPLDLAVALYNEETAKAAVAALLGKGADVNAADSYEKKTPLHVAVSEQGCLHLGVLRQLLDAGADVTAESRYNGTPLFAAVKAGFWEAAELLAERKSDLGCANTYGETLLMAAIEGGAPRPLLEKIAAASDVNAQESTPALHRALAREDGGDVDFLLALPGIDVNIPGENGDTPLLAAVRCNRAGAVAALVKAGADVNRANNAGERPLSFAVGEGREELAGILLAAGAATDLGDKKGAAPLTLAAQQGSARMVKDLLAAAEKNHETADLQTALFSAAGKGQAGAAELLLAAGAEANAVDDEGRTPLMKAARTNHPEVLSVLIKAGANPGLADADGLTAFDHAVKAKKKQAREFLAPFKREAVKAPPPKPIVPECQYVPVSKHSLEVREPGGLTMTFNFWTQQVIISRGKGNDIVQNFSDVQRQEAVTDAYNRLKALGGDPPEPVEASLQKKNLSGLGRG